VNLARRWSDTGCQHRSVESPLCTLRRRIQAASRLRPLDGGGACHWTQLARKEGKSVGSQARTKEVDAGRSRFYSCNVYDNNKREAASSKQRYNSTTAIPITLAIATIATVIAMAFSCYSRNDSKTSISSLTPHQPWLTHPDRIQTRTVWLQISHSCPLPTISSSSLPSATLACLLRFACCDKKPETLSSQGLSPHPAARAGIDALAVGARVFPAQYYTSSGKTEQCRWVVVSHERCLDGEKECVLGSLGVQSEECECQVLGVFDDYAFAE